MSERKIRPVLTFWAVTLVCVFVWWWAQRQLGAFGELLKPLLPFILIPALWKSWHWFHSRGKSDRRDHDRRHESRRDKR